MKNTRQPKGLTKRKLLALRAESFENERRFPLPRRMCSLENKSENNNYANIKASEISPESLKLSATEKQTRKSITISPIRIFLRLSFQSSLEAKRKSEQKILIHNIGAIWLKEQQEKSMRVEHVVLSETTYQ